MYQLSAPRTTGCGTDKIPAGLGLFATTDMANRYRLPVGEYENKAICESLLSYA
jgi:hypothetical protein